MQKKKKSLTKEKIKASAIELFNNKDTLSITTNHIAKHANISPGNLYYHYKNKEEIIREIYSDMSSSFENFESFKKILTSSNPLKEISNMFDNLAILFWEYRFLIRDSALLMALDSELKEHFNSNQQKRIDQIKSILEFLIKKDLLNPFENDDLNLEAKLIWFTSAYWQVFTSTMGEVTKDSINEGIHIIFKLQIYPYLTKKGKELYNF